jgi:hypothetical protein
MLLSGDRSVFGDARKTLGASRLLRIGAIFASGALKGGYVSLTSHPIRQDLSRPSTYSTTLQLTLLRSRSHASGSSQRPNF